MQDRYELFESSQNMLICELDKLTAKQELTPQTLSYLDTLVDIIKDLNEIMAEEEMKYDSRNSGRYYPMNSYESNSYGRGSSYRSRSYNNYGSMNSGRNDKSTEMLDHLYSAMDATNSEEERKRIKRMIDEIENSK